MFAQMRLLLLSKKANNATKKEAAKAAFFDYGNFLTFATIL
jgi:hypothetical protein